MQTLHKQTNIKTHIEAMITLETFDDAVVLDDGRGFVFMLNN